MSLENEKSVINKSVQNRFNVIYHNLRLIRQSVNELDYLLNNPFDGVLFATVGFPYWYYANLIDIHGRNATTLLFNLFDGDLSIIRLVNLCEQNVDFLNFHAKRVDVIKCISNAKALLNQAKAKHFSLLKDCRDTIACHQDDINIQSIDEIGKNVFPLSDMQRLLPILEQAFAYIYYPYTNSEYEQLENKSFIGEAIHIMFDKKMEDAGKS